MDYAMSRNWTLDRMVEPPLSNLPFGSDRYDEVGGHIVLVRIKRGIGHIQLQSPKKLSFQHWL